MQKFNQNAKCVPVPFVCVTAFEEDHVFSKFPWGNPECLPKSGGYLYLVQNTVHVVLLIDIVTNFSDF